MDLTGIDPLDTRAGWGDSGGETGYWALKGESYRVTHPRVKLVAKTHLSPTERETVMKLFDSGQYGTGEYNISDPEEGRQDIKWNDVKESDLVVVPTPDTNPLALGGIPISSCDGTNITTASTLWGDSTTYFSDPDLSKGEPAKPRLQAGDIVQIAGVRGMQEINGRIFRLKSCSDNGTSFTLTLVSVDGAVWSGPLVSFGNISTILLENGKHPQLMLIILNSLHIWVVVLSYPIPHIGHYVGKQICEKGKSILVRQTPKLGKNTKCGINRQVISTQDTHSTMFMKLSRVILWNMMILPAENVLPKCTGRELIMK